MRAAKSRHFSRSETKEAENTSLYGRAASLDFLTFGPFYILVSVSVSTFALLGSFCGSMTGARRPPSPKRKKNAMICGKTL